MAAEEFTNRDLTGSRFEHVDLSEVRIHDAALRDVRITGAWLKDLVIESDIEGTLTVNGVDVVPYIEEVLNARHPGRETVMSVHDGDADAFRAAWAVDVQAWAETVARARRLPAALLHERVLPGGAVYLFYDASRSDMVPNIVQKASAALTDGGFRVSVVDQKAPSVVGIIGKR